jgi:hypothetical protein
LMLVCLTIMVAPFPSRLITFHYAINWHWMSRIEMLRFTIEARVISAGLQQGPQIGSSSALWARGRDLPRAACPNIVPP